MLNNLLIILAFEVVGLAERFESCWLRDYNCHNVVLERVSVDKDHLQIGALLIHSLQFLRHDVFTLGELENVLDPVDNLQLVACAHHSYVPCVQPSLFIQHLLCEGHVLEVALKHTRPSNAHFTRGERLGHLGVVHLRHVLQLELHAHHWPSHVPCHVVIELSAERGAAGLRLAVSLHYGTAEQALQEVHHVLSNGSRCSDDESDIATQSLLDSVENVVVVEFIGYSSFLNQVLYFHPHPLLEQPLLVVRFLIHSL